MRVLLRLFEWCDRLRQRKREGTARTIALGRYGEDLAQRALQHAGMRILARNWRTRSGKAEVDVVAADGDTLVLVEVKSRQTDEYGAPERAIGSEKQRQLAWAATEYLRRSGDRWTQFRFDVVTVVLTDPPRLEHWRDVFPLPFRPRPRQEIY